MEAGGKFLGNKPNSSAHWLLQPQVAVQLWWIKIWFKYISTPLKRLWEKSTLSTWHQTWWAGSMASSTASPQTCDQFLSLLQCCKLFITAFWYFPALLRKSQKIILHASNSLLQITFFFFFSHTCSSFKVYQEKILKFQASLIQLSPQ